MQGQARGMEQAGCGGQGSGDCAVKRPRGAGRKSCLSLRPEADDIGGASDRRSPSLPPGRPWTLISVKETSLFSHQNARPTRTVSSYPGISACTCRSGHLTRGNKTVVYISFCPRSKSRVPPPPTPKAPAACFPETPSPAGQSWGAPSVLLSGGFAASPVRAGPSRVAVLVARKAAPQRGACAFPRTPTPAG